MKKIILCLLVSAGAFAQVTNPHNSPALNGQAERIANFTVTGAGNDRLEIANGTQVDGRFNPTLWSYKSTDNTYSMAITSAIAGNMDNGTSPVMIFSTTVPQQIYPGAPGSGGDFVWGPSGTSGPVAVRPLYEWRNASTRLMTILANGNTGVNTTAPTARFHTNGTLRFQGIPTATTNQYVLTADANGNVSRQLASGFGGGGVSLSCASLNYIPKITSSSGLGCSQIIDNGTNVGIGYSNPANKLSVNGNIQAISSIIISDQAYKTKIEEITNPIEIIKALRGVNYKWKIAEFPDLNFDDKLQYGLIAQEVEAVLPDIVNTAPDGFKAVNYTAIIPILIEAIQKQQLQIEELQAIIAAQSTARPSLNTNLSNTKITAITPNPSSDIAIVSINVDAAAENVQLIVADLKGALLSNISVKEKGNDITKTLHKDNFGSGTFIVSLIVNGKSIDNTKVIFK